MAGTEFRQVVDHPRTDGYGHGIGLGKHGIQDVYKRQELEFDACPYYEPSTKGDMMAPSNTDIMEYFGVTVTGATIVSVTGETSADAVISDGGATVTLRNVLVDKMIEEGLKDTYRYTNHKVKITGVTADTRIKIYSVLVGKEGENYRMWLDNLKVKKVN